ncbi:MAG: SEC-C metal-binding domain-containing protein, partial [Rikenellaceae bacterium]
MDRMGLEDGEVIQSSMMTKTIERAQKKVEENNFGTRKRLLEYDDVMNSQREVIYKRRRHALYGERIDIDLNNIICDYAEAFVETNEGIAYEDFKVELIREVATELSIDEATYKKCSTRELINQLIEDIRATNERRSKGIADVVAPVMERVYEDRKDDLNTNMLFPITDGHLGFNVPVNLQRCKDSNGGEIFKSFSKIVMFTSIDDAWRQHLREMDDLRQSVQNATYEQKDPLLIYKFESFGLFSKMLTKVNREVLAILNKAVIPVRDEKAAQEAQERAKAAEMARAAAQRQARAVQPPAQPQAQPQVEAAARAQVAAQAGSGERTVTSPITAEKRVGRNDPCPCGSGRKYKACHGKNM